MATSVYIPKGLLDAVDKRARFLKVSRNQVIVRALKKELDQEEAWSPGFLESFASVTESDKRAVDEMLVVIQRGRTSKKPPRL